MGCSLLKHFIRYSLTDYQEHLCISKTLCNDFSENLTQNNKIVVTYPL